jgi:predicted Ser/Thr protein kinase
MVGRGSSYRLEWAWGGIVLKERRTDRERREIQKSVARPELEGDS